MILRRVLRSPPAIRLHSQVNAQRAFSNDVISEYKKFFNIPKATPTAELTNKIGKSVTLHGFLGKRRKISKGLSFVDLRLDQNSTITVVVNTEDGWSEKLSSIPPYSAVAVSGQLAKKVTPTTSSSTSASDNINKSEADTVSAVELVLDSAQCLNPFDKSIIVSPGVQFPPQSRHLQLRFQPEFGLRLQYRSWLKSELGRQAAALGYTDIETPLLFKSTPEGAREFLVPTRQKHKAYALPQSPQQYKQILMASGIKAYQQFARCFRDEDLRADRQPEFTQFDLEKSFATGEDVMNDVEDILRAMWSTMSQQYKHINIDGALVPVSETSAPFSKAHERTPIPALATEKFPRLTYEDVMEKYGIDKPDLRIPGQIHRVESHVSSDFISMITRLEKPVVNAWLLRPTSDSIETQEVTKFTQDFLASLDERYTTHNPSGAPQILVYNPRLPMGGLSSLGPGGIENLEGVLQPPGGSFEPGDIILFQARSEMTVSSWGGSGSIPIGDIRNLMYKAAREQGLVSKQDNEFQFLWVTHFPMFTVNDGVDPGQGGSAGFSATHHPFTSPLTEKDVELLFRDPLAAKADHYDLVLNGMELGGGSRRIHIAHLQEFIFRDILKMTPQGIAEFDHLLRALRSGCPPHAGFAFGIDRLCALLTGTNSIRDVIPFPKNMKGEDMLVKSPRKIPNNQLGVYNLHWR